MSLVDVGSPHTRLSNNGMPHERYVNIDDLPDIDAESEADLQAAAQTIIVEADMLMARRAGKQRAGAPDTDGVIAARMQAEEGQRALQVGQDKAFARQFAEEDEHRGEDWANPPYYGPRQRQTKGQAETTNFYRYYAPPEESSSPSILGTIFTIASNLLSSPPPRMTGTRVRRWEAGYQRRQRAQALGDGSHQQSSISRQFSTSSDEISLRDDRTAPSMHLNGDSIFPPSQRAHAKPSSLQPLAGGGNSAVNDTVHYTDMSTDGLSSKRKRAVQKPRKPQKPTPADLATLALCHKAGWRRCPGCAQMVERAGGCPRLTCRCGTAWCYRCGGKIGWLRGCHCLSPTEDAGTAENGNTVQGNGGGGDSHGYASPGTISEKEPRMPGALPWDSDTDEGFGPTLEGTTDEVTEADLVVLHGIEPQQYGSGSDWDEIDGFWDENAGLAEEGETDEGPDLPLDPDSPPLQHDYLLTPGALHTYYPGPAEPSPLIQFPIPQPSASPPTISFPIPELESHSAAPVFPVPQTNALAFAAPEILFPPDETLQARDSVVINVDPRSPLHETPRNSTLLDSSSQTVRPPLRVTTSPPPLVTTPPLRPRTPNILDNVDDQEVMDRVRRSARARAIIESPVATEAEKVKARASMSMDETIGAGGNASGGRRKSGRRNATMAASAFVETGLHEAGGGEAKEGVQKKGKGRKGKKGLNKLEEAPPENQAVAPNSDVDTAVAAAEEHDDFQPVFPLPTRATPERMPSEEWARAALLKQACNHEGRWKKAAGGRCTQCDEDIDIVHDGLNDSDAPRSGGAWVSSLRCNLGPS
ncbi:hypothetical protein HGRIS_002466 [Hohenbuehelia grisea]|uniref:IBR domain-containing protein n=1 Tax=Hohenbuehelia grisea TaxID=104357 RepID=A0ABR3JKJ1_9AGAR